MLIEYRVYLRHTIQHICLYLSWTMYCGENQGHSLALRSIDLHFRSKSLTAYIQTSWLWWNMKQCWAEEPSKRPSFQPDNVKLLVIVSSHCIHLSLSRTFAIVVKCYQYFPLFKRNLPIADNSVGWFSYTTAVIIHRLVQLLFNKVRPYVPFRNNVRVR